MSRQRLFAVAGALALALLGTIGMVAYVSGAEERAASGEALAQVFLVERRVPAGTPAERLSGFIRQETVPQKLITNATVGSLADLEGLVAEVELLPGEALSIARFVDPQTFDRAVDRVVDRPPGLQEVTVALTPERAGGGLILPGDTVGVLVSFEPFDVKSDIPIEVDGRILPPNGSTNNTTFQALHKLLVTNVQLEEVPEVVDRPGLNDEETRQVRLVPSGNLLVTLAVDVTTAERLIFSSEFGTVWLTIEPDDALEGPSSIQDRGTVYEDLIEDTVTTVSDEDQQP